jgi:HAD superfamily hydrolase (TIGR01450 family)
MTKRIDIRGLLDHHRGILLDAYGVLIAQGGPLPGAVELTERLELEGRPWFLVTNDASRHPENIAAHQRSLGMTMPDERVLSSGALLTEWFADQELAGATTLVLGPADAHRMVREAGGEARAWNEVDQADVVVVADEAGYPFLEAVDAVLTLLMRALDAGRPPRLVLPNPDRVFPKAGGAFGLAAGSIAMVLEDALRRRMPDAAPRFEHLGKPTPALFEKAKSLAGTEDLVMLGDQLETDVEGANAAGIRSALVETGVGRLRDGLSPEHTPDYILDDLR